MRLVSYFDASGEPAAGVVSGEWLVLIGDRDVTEILSSPDRLTEARVKTDGIWLDGSELQAHSTRFESVSLLPPVHRPTKVIGVGMNYRSFVSQMGEPVPHFPTLFHKTASALTGSGHPIVVPPVTTQVVPEGELAIVIGVSGSNISEADAARHIAGYACANDVSARDLEFRTSQWTSGKMLPTFCPLGPWIVTPDDVDDVNNLQVRTFLNGNLIQEGSTADMVFSVYQLVSQISALVALETGDVILTGTPSDLGAQSPPVFLADGDVVSVEIPGVGRLHNPVVFAPTNHSD